MFIFKKSFLFLFIATSISISISGYALNDPLTYSDDLGRKISVRVPPSRVITLSPAITEIVFSLIPPCRIAGVSRFSNKPPAARSLPRVGTYVNPVFEKILLLKPDLVIGTAGGLSPAMGKKFEELGIPLYVAFPRKIDDIPWLYQRLGKILDCREIAKKEAEKIMLSIRNYKKSSRDLPSMSVFYLVESNPLMGAGKNTYIDDLLISGNFENILNSSLKRFPVVPVEYLIKKDPDIILVASFDRKGSSEILKRFNTLTAVREKRVYYLNPDIFNRPGPAIISAMDKLSKIHRELSERMRNPE